MTKEQLKVAILENIPHFLCVIENKDGEIIYPTDVLTLKKLNRIENSQTEVPEIYHIEKHHEWYERETKTVVVDGENLIFHYYRNISKYKSLEEVLQRDYTTGVANRTTAIAEINEYIGYAINNDEEFSVLISDVDLFKKINDTYGHLFGDIVLKNIGDLIKKNSRFDANREKDIAGRFGGDEFFGIIKNISEEDTKAWIIRAEKMVSELVHKSINGDIKITGVTMSIGMFHVSHKVLEILSSSSFSIEKIRKELFNLCDHELYEVKEKHHKEEKAGIRKLVQIP